MKFITSILSTLVLAACSSEPVIIPDPTTDNVVMMEIKDRISQPGGTQPTYGWLYWYGPLAVLLLMWGYRHLIRKPINCLEEEPNATNIGKDVKKVEVDGEAGD